MRFKFIFNIETTLPIIKYKDAIFFIQFDGKEQNKKKQQGYNPTTIIIQFKILVC